MLATVVPTDACTEFLTSIFLTEIELCENMNTLLNHDEF